MPGHGGDDFTAQVDGARTVRLAAAAESARAELGASISASDRELQRRYLEPVVAEMLPEVREQAHAEGRQMLHDQALTYVLEGLLRAQP